MHLEALKPMPWSSRFARLSHSRFGLPARGILLAVLLLPFTACGTSTPQSVQRALETAVRYPSPDGVHEVQVVQYSKDVAARDSGILIRSGRKRTYLRIPKLVGVGPVQWSPGGSYLAVDNGTYALRGLIVVSLKRNRVLGSVQYLAGEFQWIAEDSIVATTPNGTRADGNVDRYGITKYTFSDLAIQTLGILVPDELTDYHLVQVNSIPPRVKKIVLRNTGDPSPYKRYVPVSEVVIDLP